VVYVYRGELNKKHYRAVRLPPTIFIIAASEEEGGDFAKIEIEPRDIEKIDLPSSRGGRRGGEERREERVQRK